MNNHEKAFLFFLRLYGVEEAFIKELKIIKNENTFDDYFNRMRKSKVDTDRFLLACFLWDRSIYGCDFWEEIHYLWAKYLSKSKKIWI